MLLGKSFNIRTLFLLQIHRAIPHSRFLLNVPEVFIRHRFNDTLLIYGQANILQSLFDVEAKITFLVEMLSPSGDQFSLRISVSVAIPTIVFERNCSMLSSIAFLLG